MEKPPVLEANVCFEFHYFVNFWLRCREFFVVLMPTFQIYFRIIIARGAA